VELAGARVRLRPIDDADLDALETMFAEPARVMRKYERGADGTFHDSLLMDVLADELA
jgi:hypothetical protein